jgi:hypothetical protein
VKRTNAITNALWDAADALRRTTSDPARREVSDLVKAIIIGHVWGVNNTAKYDALLLRRVAKLVDVRRTAREGASVLRNVVDIATERAKRAKR